MGNCEKATTATGRKWRARESIDVHVSYVIAIHHFFDSKSRHIHPVISSRSSDNRSSPVHRSDYQVAPDAMILLDERSVNRHREEPRTRVKAEEKYFRTLWHSCFAFGRSGTPQHECLRHHKATLCLAINRCLLYAG